MTRIGTRIILVCSGLAVAGSLLAPALAAADPGGSGMLSTTCSFDQIDAALRAQAPDLAAKLDANPEKKARLQDLLNLPVDQRQQKIQEFLNTHPDAQAKMQERRNSPEFQQHADTLRAVLDSCHNY
ncbi:hemophore-related protein [Nocardia sp. NPDC020380]|uniref:hemophore-related protein n=1 Tax=Nocardia sp. NPDC020380 TaxID=3364309 RepID=UPI0037B33CF1